MLKRISTPFMTIFLLLVIALLTVLLFMRDSGTYCRHVLSRDTVPTVLTSQEKERKIFRYNGKAPSSLEAEHNELHKELDNAINEKGLTGAAAEELSRLLAPHFEKENKYALPLLSVLPALANGQAIENKQSLISITSTLEQDMPDMLNEHKKISSALEKLKDAAQKEKKNRYVIFCDKLKQHALTEEEILYPAAIVAGRYLQLKNQLSNR